MSVNIIETDWKWNGGTSGRSSTKYIVLHHAASASASAEQVDGWHKSNGWAGIGYHFYVRKDGSIYRGRPLTAVGAHVSGKNNISIGICAEGDYTAEQMPAAQKTAIAELLDYLKSNYYPNAEIVGHGEIGSSSCPGDNYPLGELKNYKKFLKGNEDIMSKEYEELKSKITALENAQEKVYHYGIELPDWGKPTVVKLMNKGYFNGVAADDLNLPESMLRLMVINDRAGLYD